MNGLQIEYRTYQTTYGLAIDDSVDTTEAIRTGVIVGVAKRHVRVRDDASGKVVNVLHHRLVKRSLPHLFIPLSGSRDGVTNEYTRCSIDGCCKTASEH